MSIAQNIRHFRENKGISVDHFSRMTGISLSDCIKIEAGQRPLSSDEINNICRVLGITSDELIAEQYTEPVEEGGSVAMPMSELQNLLKMMKN